MKKTIDISLFATLCGGVLFSVLFWREGLGLNLLFYSIFIVSAVLITHKAAMTRKAVTFAAFHLFATLLVVYNHSSLTLTAWYISLACFIGFTYLPSIRSIFTAIAATLNQLLCGPIQFITKLSRISVGTYSPKPLLRWLKFGIIPILLVIIFATLYSNANPTLGKYISILFNNIASLLTNCFNFIFGELSLPRLLHCIAGILVTATLVMKYHHKSLMEWELSISELLIRKKRKQLPNTNGSNKIQLVHQKNVLSLKVENFIGILSFLALNMLLFLLNSIDIFTLWIRQASESTRLDYSNELHDGTNALIGSILAAMAVIIYFFRGNLNFYSKNKTIVALAYIWIAQNAFLVASVFLRDYHYIEAHGLTYKRIGVIIFLMLTLIGLYTVYLKVDRQKKLFYLIRVNGLIWYIFLLVGSLFNWDTIIVSYNLQHKDVSKISVNHLLSLSDQTLPLLYSNIDTIKKMKGIVPQQALNEIDDALEQKRSSFNQRRKNVTWLSWNYRDWKTLEYLNKISNKL